MTFSEKQIFALKMVKVACGVAGGAMVINDNHPYFTVVVLVVGAVANEALNYNKNKK